MFVYKYLNCCGKAPNFFRQLVDRLFKLAHSVAVGIASKPCPWKKYIYEKLQTSSVITQSYYSFRRV